MMSPPTAGPPMRVTWKRPNISATAAGSWARGTRLGTVADRAGWSTAPSPAATALTA